VSFQDLDPICPAVDGDRISIDYPGARIADALIRRREAWNSECLSQPTDSPHVISVVVGDQNGDWPKAAGESLQHGLSIARIDHNGASIGSPQHPDVVVIEGRQRDE
jgi:hypothetical protein